MNNEKCVSIQIGFMTLILLVQALITNWAETMFKIRLKNVLKMCLKNIQNVFKICWKKMC
jgi:hypothetical protein